MTTCPCGATGFYNRRDLAGHLIDKHRIGNGPRALMLAQRIIDKLALSPEDCAVLGIEPRSPAPPPGTTRERQKASETRQLVDGGLPDDASLNRAVEEAGHPRCARCGERPPMATQTWCAECLTEVGKTGVAKRQRRAKTTPPPAAAPPAEPAAAIVTTSSPTPDAGAAGESVRSQETPMAKSEDCKVCARLTKKAGEPTKCKRHGGAGVKPGQKKAKPAKTPRGARGRTAAGDAAPNGRVDLKDNVAKAAGQTFLTGLYKLRDKLSAHIKGVEELVGAL